MFEWDMRYRIILVNMKMYSKKYLHILRTFAIEFRSRKSSAVMKKGMEKGEKEKNSTFFLFLVLYRQRNLLHPFTISTLHLSTPLCIGIRIDRRRNAL